MRRSTYYPAPGRFDRVYRRIAEVTGSIGVGSLIAAVGCIIAGQF